MQDRPKRTESGGKGSPFRLPFSSSIDTNVSLVVSLGIEALQAGGYTVTPWIAVPCWFAVLVLILDLIWRLEGASVWTRRVPLTAIAFAIIGLLSYRAVAGPTITLGMVQVSFSERKRFPATQLVYSGTIQKNMDVLSESAKNTPLYTLNLRPNAGKVVMSVIVRNLSKTPIRNARVFIYSTKPIVAKSMGAYTFSPNMVVYEERVLSSYGRVGEEYFISIEFQDEVTVPLMGISVAIDGENMKPYVGVGKFAFIRPQ